MLPNVVIQGAGEQKKKKNRSEQVAVMTNDDIITRHGRNRAAGRFLRFADHRVAVGISALGPIRLARSDDLRSAVGRVSQSADDRRSIRLRSVHASDQTTRTAAQLQPTFGNTQQKKKKSYMYLCFPF